MPPRSFSPFTRLRARSYVTYVVSSATTSLGSFLAHSLHSSLPLSATLRPPVRRHTRAIDDRRRRRRRRATPVPLGSVCEKWRENYEKRDLFSRASLMAARPACPSLRLVFPVETENAPVYTHIYMWRVFQKNKKFTILIRATDIFCREKNIDSSRLIKEWLMCLKDIYTFLESYKQH